MITTRAPDGAKKTERTNQETIKLQDNSAIGSFEDVLQITKTYLNTCNCPHKCQIVNAVQKHI